MKSFFALFLAASTFLVVSADEAIGLCCLCEGCKPVVRGREFLTVNDKGKTCNALYMELADPTNESKTGNALCRDQIRKFRPRCCDPKYNPPVIIQAPTPAPNFGMEEGNEPICNICRDGSYPTQPFAKIVTFDRFIKGEKTCDELYRMGLTGNIPDQICNPLVNFAVRPCGCVSKSDNSISIPMQPPPPPTPRPPVPAPISAASPINAPTANIASPVLPPSPTPRPPVPAPTSAASPINAPTASISSPVLPPPPTPRPPVPNPTIAPTPMPLYDHSSWKDSTMWKMIERRLSKLFNRGKRRLRGNSVLQNSNQ